MKAQREGQRHTFTRSLPPGKRTGASLQEAEWASGPVWAGVWKFRPPPLPLRFDPRIVQLVESLCTDCAILARYIFHNNWIWSAARRRGRYTEVEIRGGGQG
jgi:hypothetical protein